MKDNYLFHRTCKEVGKFESNSFNKLYELLLRVSFGKYGYASVNSVLKIHNIADVEFHIFLDTVGEEWK